MGSDWVVPSTTFLHLTHRGSDTATFPVELERTLQFADLLQLNRDALMVLARIVPKTEIELIRFPIKRC